mmetsp:Transcript_15988/g.43101  ORF Transcript_15988/g.43101 Transcript_15988/m.43101 type:complete len:216 (+) Transcript_15988:650-1297(+)
MVLRVRGLWRGRGHRVYLYRAPLPRGAHHARPARGRGPARPALTCRLPLRMVARLRPCAHICRALQARQQRLLRESRRSPRGYAARARHVGQGPPRGAARQGAGVVPRTRGAPDHCWPPGAHHSELQRGWRRRWGERRSPCARGSRCLLLSRGQWRRRVRQCAAFARKRVRCVRLRRTTDCRTLLLMMTKTNKEKNPYCTLLQYPYPYSWDNYTV